MVSAEALHQLLTANPAVGLAPSVGLTEPFVLDSLALTWLVHYAGEQYQLELDPDDQRVAGTTTIDQLAGYFTELQASRQ